MESNMTCSKLLAGAAALALLAAVPAETFAQGRGHGGPGGGAHMGGGGGARMGGGPRMGGGGPGPSANFARGPGAGANFARSSAPTANFAARSPNVNANVNVGNRGAFAGNRTAWNGGGRGGYYRNGRWIPGALAAGAVVGGALAANAYYGDPYYYGDTGPGYYGDTYYDNGPYETGTEVAVVQDGGVDASYCAQRYRSWDPASQTYLGYDGQRHPCP
jgi:hypothetical protein